MLIDATEVLELLDGNLPEERRNALRQQAIAHTGGTIHIACHSTPQGALPVCVMLSEDQTPEMVADLLSAADPDNFDFDSWKQEFIDFAHPIDDLILNMIDLRSVTIPA